jgi:ATP-dependent DNA helicase RecQ
LLRGTEDRRIQDFFIEQAFPAQEKVQAVLAELSAATAVGEGRTSRELMAVVNLGAGRIEAMLKILDVEGAVRRDGTRWRAVEGSDWRYDGERYAQITALRRAEQEAMASFGTDGRCLMRALQEELDDPAPADCGRCSVCAGPRYAAPPAPGLVEQAQRHLRSQPIVLEQRKMAPDPGGTMRKIPVDALIEPGWALARLGDGGWWPAIERGLHAGRLDDEVAVALAEALNGRASRRAGAAAAAAGSAVDWVTSVPSAQHGTVLDQLAEAVARQLGVPRLRLLERREERPPQREMANAAQQAANVRGAFAVVQPPPPGTGVLLDDRRLSGFTFAMVGGQLRKAGAEAVVPLALATLN